MTSDGCTVDYMNFTYLGALLVHIYCMILLKMKYNTIITTIQALPMMCLRTRLAFCHVVLN